MPKKESHNSISEAEWEVMRVIWTLGEARTSQVIEELREK